MIWLELEDIRQSLLHEHSLENNSCSVFENTELRKTDFSVSLDPESHSDIHPTTLKPYVAHRIWHAAFY